MLQKLDFPSTEAQVYLQGAHLTRFQDWLFLSSRSQFDMGKAIRGGIPVIFPWFGPHPGDKVAPQHGWARTSLWTVESQDANSVTLCISTQGMNTAAGQWPFQARLEYRFSEALEARFSVENLGATPTRFECALHSYFAVSDISRVSIEGLDGLTYKNKTRANERFTQKGSLTFEGEVDRVYFAAPSPLRLHDGESGYELSGDWKSAVTWNPGAEKAASMSDLGEDEWRRFACLEVGAIGDDAIELEAGKMWEMNLRVTRK